MYYELNGHELMYSGMYGHWIGNGRILQSLPPNIYLEVNMLEKSIMIVLLQIKLQTMVV